jgi:hypothetical protein
VGIVNQSSNRWILARLIGDKIDYPTGNKPGGPWGDWGGRAMVGYTETAYIALRICGVVSFFTGYWESTYKCTRSANGMMAADEGLRRLAHGSKTARGDGIVAEPSQYYPSGLFNYRILGADSHVGELRSSMVRNNIDLAFSQYFNVPRR